MFNCFPQWNISFRDIMCLIISCLFGTSNRDICWWPVEIVFGNALTIWRRKEFIQFTKIICLWKFKTCEPKKLHIPTKKQFVPSEIWRDESSVISSEVISSYLRRTHYEYPCVVDWTEIQKYNVHVPKNLHIEKPQTSWFYLRFLAFCTNKYWIFA